MSFVRLSRIGLHGVAHFLGSLGVFCLYWSCVGAPVAIYGTGTKINSVGCDVFTFRKDRNARLLTSKPRLAKSPCRGLAARAFAGAASYPAPAFSCRANGLRCHFAFTSTVLAASKIVTFAGTRSFGMTNL